jgi:hypothetical protein
MGIFFSSVMSRNTVGPTQTTDQCNSVFGPGVCGCRCPHFLKFLVWSKVFYLLDVSYEKYL